jgi:hypothetical protein
MDLIESYRAKWENHIFRMPINNYFQIVIDEAFWGDITNAGMRR